MQPLGLQFTNKHQIHSYNSISLEICKIITRQSILMLIYHLLFPFLASYMRF